MPTPTCWCKYNVHGYLMVKLIVKLCVDSTVYMCHKYCGTLACSFATLLTLLCGNLRQHKSPDVELVSSTLI